MARSSAMTRTSLVADNSRVGLEVAPESAADSGRITRLDVPRRGQMAPHSFEQFIKFELQARHTFLSLVVRRIPGGVCLQGVVVDDDEIDIEVTARELAGVDHVVNQLVVIRS